MTNRDEIRLRQAYWQLMALAYVLQLKKLVALSTVASNVVQGAFEAIGTLTYGNGLNRTVTFDDQGRIGSIVAGSIQKLQYGYDANSNITGITDNVDNTKSRTYAYDALDRLTGATGPWGTLAYTYDGVGNRKTETTATGTTNYTYTANKLMSSTGEKTLTFGYDGNGNATVESGRQYVYNQNQRLIKAAEGAAAVGEYVYNANGQRVKKTAGGAATTYHFDINGQLIAEGDDGGNIAAEYVYLNGQPVAKIDSTGISYILTDHLGTPVVMTDGSGQKVWEIESKPFGDMPSITGTATLNIRFPGQYYDAETGLHYNYFRDYEPKVGRYVEADPIGILIGENNLYAYVGNNSVRLYDHYGLVEWVKVTSGVLKVLAGGSGVVVAATSEVGSAGAATALAISVAGVSVPLMSAGISEIVVGFANKKAKIICPDAVSLGLIIYSKDLEKAERMKFIYDLLMFSKGNISFMMKVPAKTERIQYYLESTEFTYDYAYKLFVRSNEKFAPSAKDKQKR